ncbi:MAG: flagellar export chaperone FliS [Methylococcales bacterium]|nr:flagellar export chaperone FliS [Methylococcales bacterium]
MNSALNRALNQYQQFGTRASADQADSHQLIVMLFDGALERIAVAKGAMARADIELKGQKISRAIAIINGLQASLDADKGGEIANNLFDLYDYMQRRLIAANSENSSEALDEVSDLLKEIREAWQAIPMEYRALQ